MVDLMVWFRQVTIGLLCYVIVVVIGAEWGGIGFSLPMFAFWIFWLVVV